MTISNLFKKEFALDNLFSIYLDKIQNKATIGVDGLNRDRFENKLVSELNIVERKVKINAYKYTPYKCICILRGINKKPRVVEKPSIRDRIVLRAIYNILLEKYRINLTKRHLHSQIKRLIQSLNNNNYNYILKYDVVDFFPTINHKILIKKLKYRIRKIEFISLIKNAITNVHDIAKKSGIIRNESGVPQGLSISNILSNIYLFNIDLKYENDNAIEYFRFVDDILILCNESESDNIRKNIKNDFKKIKLELHIENKYSAQKISDKFDYLGYTFENGKIGVRTKSLNKIRVSLINILCSYKYKKVKNNKLLIFKINLRITGCIIRNKKYGWVFYFSQITNEEILHSLDNYIKKQLERYGIEIKGIKSFVRTWKEINKNLNSTKYIPNYDNFSNEQKEKIIRLYNLKYNIVDIEKVFLTIINREIKNLEKDMAGLS